MIGQLVGNYRVLRLLGQGGMGQVFEAVHEQIKRRAAIKVLNPDFSQHAEVVQRFFNEALAVNVIQHPSIVGVFESGQLSSGAAFIVMEFLDGMTLSAHLKKEGAFAEKDALLLVRQIASALAAAHAKDIVHRDLKSDNVMLVKDPEVPGGRRVKILDFGLAKVAVKHQSNAVQTREGTVMGTPSYMPPEQWMSATLVDAKSDVYSLGVMLFEMITGTRPFVGESTNQVMMGHLYEEPPKIATLVPEISTETSRLVALMLNKTRGSRPTMDEVSKNIERLLAAPPALPSPAASPPAGPRGQPAIDPVMAPTMLPSALAIAKPDPPGQQWTDMKISAEAPSAPPETAQPLARPPVPARAVPGPRPGIPMRRRQVEYILLAVSLVLAAIIVVLLAR